MTTLYVVEDGSYSDYSVKGIYSTREKAERAHQLFNADREVAEWELDPVFKGAPDGMLFYSVAMDKSGDSEVSHANAERASSLKEWQPCSGQRVSFHMWAEDKKHAVKIADERRTRIIADGEWTTDWNEWCKRSTP